MTTPATPSGSKPSGDDRNLVAVDATNATTFEDRAQLFWERNRKLVWALIIAVLVIIGGKAVWEYREDQKELEIQKNYAAATTPEQLKSFIAAHRDHALAGAAELTLADQAFTAGKFADATAGYDRALTTLKSPPLVARAKIGRALGKAQTGKAAEAASELKTIADDANQVNTVRTEALYHLAAIALEAGNAAEATKHVEQIFALEKDSFNNPWVRRAGILRTRIPLVPAPAASAVAPAPTAPATPAANPGNPAPAGPAKSEEAPKVQVKLPGK